MGGIKWNVLCLILSFCPGSLYGIERARFPFGGFLFRSPDPDHLMMYIGSHDTVEPGMCERVYLGTVFLNKD